MSKSRIRAPAQNRRTTPNRKRDRRDKGRQETDNNQQNFSRKNISEQPERKRNHFCELGNKLKKSDKKSNRISERIYEKLSGVMEKSKRSDSENLRRDNGNYRQRERHIYIGITGTEIRHKNFMSPMLLKNPIVPTPGKIPIQFEVIMKIKIVATIGKNLRVCFSSCVTVLKKS